MMKGIKYERINFKDHVVEHPNRVKIIDNEDGTIILKKDEGEILEQGTPHSANIMNKLDKGIDEAHIGIYSVEKELEKVRVQLELDGRVPNSNGAFFDVLDGSDSKNIKLDTTKSDVTESLVAGTLNIKVSSVEGFKKFTEVTIQDDANSEDVTITDIDDVGKTITVNQLLNDYKKGAVVARSTVDINTETQEMDVDSWGTFDLEEVM